MKKILVIAVHPDDETLGCGGTLLKHKMLGDSTYWLILTRPNEKINHIENIDAIESENIQKVAKEYSFTSFTQLDLLTTALDTYPIGDLIQKIAKVINEIKPQIIYFQHYGDVHTDHRVAFEAIYSCTKNFRFPFIERLLLFETLSETEFAPANSNNAFVPNTFSDISDHLEKKLEIMQYYNTEIMEEPFPRSLSSIRALSRFRGSRIGVTYAEAFITLYDKF